MWLLLNWRVWVLGALLISYPVTYLKGRHDGKQVQLQLTASLVAQANIEAHKNEQLRQDRVDEAAKVAAARQRSLVDSARAARAERDGMLDTLSALQRASADSQSSTYNALRLTSELLGSCTASYLRVAEEADRADAEARELRQAWPH
jgi:hypothetical protein